MLMALAASDPTVDEFDDNDPDPPVLINRARPFHFNVELSLMFMPTLIEKYLNHTGGVAAITVHMNDIFALEAFGGYVYMREAAIIGGAESVRSQNPTMEPALPDLVGMSWIAQAGVAIAPIYGKLNFFSEVDMNSQFYICGGIGAIGAVKRQNVSVNPDEFTTEIVPLGARFAGNVGAGFKLFFTNWFGLRGEFRDIIFSDSFDYAGTGDPTPDVIHNFVGMFGLTFIVN